MDEFSLLARLTAGAPRSAEGLLCGVGDDCAVLPGGQGRDWLISTDNFHEGVHFSAAWATWEQIGRKAVLSAVSDVSAMGGRPRFLLVALGLPAALPTEHIEACYAGIREAGLRVNAQIIGGDTTRSHAGVQLGITVVGEAAHGRTIYRRGARVGDHVYVTGTLGGAGAGLLLLQQHDVESHPDVVDRHLEPPIRVPAAGWLAASGCLSAMIDVSDGLLADLGHIARASGVGMRLEALRIPLTNGLQSALQRVQDTAASTASVRGEAPSGFAGGGGRHEPPKIDLLQFAVATGEAYELAFVVSGARSAAFAKLVSGAERALGHAITKIGEVVTGDDVQLIDPHGAMIPLTSHGFAHQFGAA